MEVGLPGRVSAGTWLAQGILGDSFTAKIENHQLRAPPINPGMTPQLWFPSIFCFFLWLTPERACLSGFCFNSCHISMFSGSLLAVYLSPHITSVLHPLLFQGQSSGALLYASLSCFLCPGIKE